MLRLLAAALLAVSLVSPGRAQSAIAGDWAGEITGTGLTAILHITETDGALATTLDVPAQGAVGLPTGETTFAGGQLIVTVPLVGGGFTGTLVADSVAGMWSQGGASLPLVLRRLADGAAAPVSERADAPRAPFPYRDADVTVASVDGVTLAGTLTIPDGPGPFPAAVLVTGSGPQDRDEALLGHRPFHVLADALARRGVAVLRYDDRGVGGSTGAFRGATTADFARDAQAVAEWLAVRPEVSSVTVVGHSEGGLIAPIVADASTAVGAVVLLAGPSVPGADVLAYQLTRGIGEAGVSAAGAATYRMALRDALAELARGDSATAGARATATLQAGTSALSAADRTALGPDAFAAERLADTFGGPWERYFLGYDPAPALQALRVPALAVFGALDTQVRASDNVPAMRAALAGAPVGTGILVLPNRNHLFQPTETGDGAEYSQIDTSFDPAMMTAVADWILAR